MFSGPFFFKKSIIFPTKSLNHLAAVFQFAARLQNLGRGVTYGLVIVPAHPILKDYATKYFYLFIHSFSFHITHLSQ